MVFVSSIFVFLVISSESESSSSNYLLSSISLQFDVKIISSDNWMIWEKFFHAVSIWDWLSDGSSISFWSDLAEVSCTSLNFYKNGFKLLIRFMKRTLLNFSAVSRFSFSTDKGYLDMKFSFLKVSYSGLKQQLVRRSV